MQWEVKNVEGQRGYGAHDWYQVQLISQGLPSIKGKKFRFGDREAAFAERDRLNAELAKMVAPCMGFNAQGMRALVDAAAE